MEKYGAEYDLILKFGYYWVSRLKVAKKPIKVFQALLN